MASVIGTDDWLIDGASVEFNGSESGLPLATLLISRRTAPLLPFSGNSTDFKDSLKSFCCGSSSFLADTAITGDSPSSISRSNTSPHRDSPVMDVVIGAFEILVPSRGVIFSFMAVEECLSDRLAVPRFIDCTPFTPWRGAHTSPSKVVGLIFIVSSSKTSSSTFTPLIDSIDFGDEKLGFRSIISFRGTYLTALLWFLMFAAISSPFKWWTNVWASVNSSRESNTDGLWLVLEMDEQCYYRSYQLQKPVPLHWARILFHRALASNILRWPSNTRCLQFSTML